MVGLLNTLLGMPFAMPVISVTARVVIGTLWCRGMACNIYPVRNLGRVVPCPPVCLHTCRPFQVHRHTPWTRGYLNFLY